MKRGWRDLLLYPADGGRYAAVNTCTYPHLVCFGSRAMVSKQERERRALKSTAYHEAGHVVAAFTLRRGIKHVCIVPNFEMGALGDVQPKDKPANLNLEFDPDPRSRA
jgi:hypothetical protein